MAVLSLFLAAILVGADQLFKFLTVQNIALGENVPIFPGLLSFTHIRNEGMAFGLLEGQRWVFVGLTAVLALVIILALFRYPHHNKLSYLSSAILLGGGIGNLIDRAFLGYVVDYIKVSFFPPVFNFADCCVTVGSILLVIFVLFYTDPKKSKAES